MQFHLVIQQQEYTGRLYKYIDRAFLHFSEFVGGFLCNLLVLWWKITAKKLESDIIISWQKDQANGGTKEKKSCLMCDDFAMVCVLEIVGCLISLRDTKWHRFARRGIDIQLDERWLLQGKEIDNSRNIVQRDKWEWQTVELWLRDWQSLFFQVLTSNGEGIILISTPILSVTREQWLSDQANQQGQEGGTSRRKKPVFSLEMVVGRKKTTDGMRENEREKKKGQGLLDLRDKFLQTWWGREFWLEWERQTYTDKQEREKESEKPIFV